MDECEKFFKKASIFRKHGIYITYIVLIYLIIVFILLITPKYYSNALLLTFFMTLIFYIILVLTNNNISRNNSEFFSGIINLFSFIKSIYEFIINSNTIVLVTVLFINILILFLLITYLSRLFITTNYTFWITIYICIIGLITLGDVFFMCALLLRIIEKFTGKEPVLSLDFLNNFTIYIIMYCLIIFFILLTLYYYYYTKNHNDTSIQLLNEPVSLKVETRLPDYFDIYGFVKNKDTNKFVKYYNFSVSFWFYIDTTNGAIDKYKTIFNCDYNPIVMYNPGNNSLKVSIFSEKIFENCKLLIKGDETLEKIKDCKTNSTNIIFESKDFSPQKWNNMVLIYNNGIIDIFYNNEMVKSSKQKIPYIETQNITIGEFDGLNGGICNIKYFKSSINSSQINEMYNNVKKYNPPISKII